VLLDAGLAQMIQSIYVAAENMLLKIAASSDGGTPEKDDNWHAVALLVRMAHEFPGRRPAVLSAQSLDHLTQLIPSSVQVETNNPRPSGEAAKACGVGGQAREACFQLADHTAEVRKDAIGKLLLAHLVPDVLRRIEFGRIGR
jgi:hypothetical protein